MGFLADIVIMFLAACLGTKSHRIFTIFSLISWTSSIIRRTPALSPPPLHHPQPQKPRHRSHFRHHPQLLKPRSLELYLLRQSHNPRRNSQHRLSPLLHPPGLPPRRPPSPGHGNSTLNSPRRSHRQYPHHRGAALQLVCPQVTLALLRLNRRTSLVRSASNLAEPRAPM